MNDFDDKTLRFQRELLQDELRKCSPENQKRFNEVFFPNGVKDHHLKSVFGLVQRTIQDEKSTVTTPPQVGGQEK